MDEHIDSQTPQRTRRRQGQRMQAEEKQRIKAAFLQSFAMMGNVRLACQKAGVSRASLYEWLEKDTPFSIEYHQAEKDFYDLAFGEFVKRAIQGYEKPVVSMGRVVMVGEGKEAKPLMELVKSDRLLEMIIKRGFPEYREKLEHTGQGGGPLQVEVSYVNDWRSHAAPEDTSTDAPQRTNRRS